MSDAELVEDHDVLIEGTNLANSVLAAALSQAGLKVVHLDRNDYYGGIDACISAPDFRAPGHILNFEVTQGPAFDALGKSKDYNLEVAPKLLYAASEMVQTLRNTSIGDYVEFRALNSFYICRDGTFFRVPSSKADVFTDTSLPLITKRRLMKFLKYCLEPSEDELKYDSSLALSKLMQTTFRLDKDITEAIVFSLGQCFDLEASIDQVLPTIRMHLKSLGLFGAFPVVIPMYGAASELSQAFCRKAAVKGATYILGQQPKAVPKARETVELSSGHCLRVKQVASSLQYPPLSQRRRLRTVIAEGDMSSLMEGGDGACIAFTSSRAFDGVIQCMVLGSSTGACPPGQYIIYLSGEGPNVDFDGAQSTLTDTHNLRAVAQLDYDIADRLILKSYDEIVKDARIEFERITGSNPEAFLPREETSDDDESL